MPTHPTLAYGVFQMSQSTDNTLSNDPARLASCMVLAIPILVLFIAFRNKIMGNVSMGGVKE
jgi:ABC-type maltose transport system permease subunit